MPPPPTSSPSPDGTPGPLLEELAWLQGLARRLVGDQAAADDLVQETWLAALRRFGRNAMPSRGWLSSRLRSNASNRRRAERRRGEREEEVARREAVPSTSDLVLRSEAQQQVLAAVLELPTELHDALVLRFSDGLSVTEIAQRQGCAKSTASERIERGLGALRRRMHETDSQGGWASCLLLARLPDMRRPPVAPPDPVSPGLWSSVLVSKKLIVAAAGVVALVALIANVDGLVEFAGGEADPEVAAIEPPVQSPTEPGPDPARDETTSFAAEAQRLAVKTEPLDDLASPDDYVLAGLVTDLDEVPLADVSIRMLEGERLHSETRSLPDGTFELRLAPDQLEPIASGTFLRALIVAPGGYERRQFEFSDTDNADFPLPRSGSTDRLPPQRLPRATHIAGRVLDEEGLPVVGASVDLNVADPKQDDGFRGFSGPTGNLGDETDAEGRFRLEGVPPGAYFVEAAHSRFEFMESFVPVTCGIDEPAQGVEVTLRHAPLLTGRVEDMQGEPIEGVYLSTNRFMYRSTVQSDAEGRFAVPMRGGGSAHLQVSAFGHEVESPSLDQEVSPADSGMVLVLRPFDATTVFQLVDAETGAPVTSAACILRPVELWEGLQSVKDDNTGDPRPRENGIVRTQATPGKEALVVAAPGYARHAVRVQHESPYPPHQIVELQPAQGMRGRLLSRGAPVRGARVRLHGTRFRLNWPRFTLDAGRVGISDEPRMDMSDLGLTSYELKGVLGLDGPPPDYRAIPWSRVLAATRTDAEGRFFLDESHVGAGLLSFEDDHGTSAIFPFEGLPSAAGQDLGDFDLQKTATITGRIDLGGLPHDRALRIEIEGLDRSAAVRSTGEFLLEGLPAGDIYLDVDEVDHDEGPYLVREPSFHLHLRPGEQRDVVLPIAHWLACRIEANITVGGVPAPRSAQLQVRPIDGDRPWIHQGPVLQKTGRIEDHLSAEGLCEVQLHMPQTGAWPGKLRGDGILLDLQPGGFIQQDLDFPVGRLTLEVRNAAQPGEKILLDLELRSTDGHPPEEIRHIQFAPTPEDPSLWRCAPLKVSPGSYTATLFSHDTTPRTAREDARPIVTIPVDLPMDGHVTATGELP